MNTFEATQMVVDLHGYTFVYEPAKQESDYDPATDQVILISPSDPVDELSCDECGRWVAWVSDGEGGGEFVYYGISKPHDVVVIECEDCYGID